MPKRYFVERRHGPRDYAPVGMQPANGFASVQAAQEWLAERGWINRRVDRATGEPYWHGWGGERGFYTKAVPVRHVEPPTPATGTLADSRAELSGIEPLRIPAEVREPPRRTRAWRALRRRVVSSP